jgi:hypothetical protein
MGIGFSSRIVEAEESVARGRMVSSARGDGGSRCRVVVDVGMRLLGKRVGLYHDGDCCRTECANPDFASHGDNRTLEPLHIGGIPELGLAQAFHPRRLRNGSVATMSLTAIAVNIAPFGRAAGLLGRSN